MTPSPTSTLRYDAPPAQPVYPPYLAASVGYPHGRNTFPPAEPGNPSMLPGYPAPQPIAEQPPRSHRRPAPAPAQPAPAQPAPAQPAPAQPAPAHPSAPVPISHQQPMHPQPTYPPTYQPYAGYTTGEHNLAAHQLAYAAYHQSQQAVTDDPGTTRPRALLLGVTTGLLAAGLTAASQALALFSGRTTIEALLTTQLPIGSDLLPGWIEATVRDLYHTMQMRAFISLGLCLVLSLIVASCLRAGLTARLAALLVMALTGLLTLVCVFDLFPSGARMLGVAALVLFPVTAALLFMPSVGQYRMKRMARREIGVPLRLAGAA